MLALLSEHEDIIEVNKDNLEEILKRKDLIIIDVRSAIEFENEDTIEGARNIPINFKDFMEKLEKLSENGSYLLYCNNGRRSAIAIKYFKRLKYNNIYYLKGGISSIY